MLIAAGLRYLTKSIAENIMFFGSLPGVSDFKILIIFFILILLCHISIIKKFEKNFEGESLEKGYITATIIILISLIIVILFL